MDGGDVHSSDGLAPLLVVEACDTPAAAFAAALMGDFGATVVICEPPDGSPLRRLGAAGVRDVWWSILARNKLSLAVDPDHPRAASVMGRIAARADLLLRDGAGRGETLAARAADRLLDVQLLPPGADRPDLWPWSVAPEFAAAATGMMALTGDPDGPAMQPEFPLADYTSGLLAASGALAELRAARLAGRKPTPLRIGLHEALQRMNEWHLVVAGAQGRAEWRNGNRFPMNSNIGNIFRTRDGKLLTVSAATPSVADRLLTMIGGPELRDDPRFRTPADRRRNMDALDAIIAEWMSRHDADRAMELVRENDVVVGPIYDADDILADAHVAARGDVVRVSGEGGESIAMPAPLPRIEDIPGKVRHPGPRVGADTRHVLKRLDFSDDEIEDLLRCGVVRT